MSKDEQIVDLVKQVISLKTELKDVTGGYRDQIKDLERQIKDLIDEEASKS
jgi:predicted component of type VI protein secretion system